MDTGPGGVSKAEPEPDRTQVRYAAMIDTERAPPAKRANVDPTRRSRPNGVRRFGSVNSMDPRYRGGGPTLVRRGEAPQDRFVRVLGPFHPQNEARCPEAIRSHSRPPNVVNGAEESAKRVRLENNRSLVLQVAPKDRMLDDTGRSSRRLSRTGGDRWLC